VELTDEALALLWRQAWPGNLRQLESLVYKLVLLYRGQTVGKYEILEMSQRFALGIRPRLSSRQPRREDLLQALDYTRTSGGRTNKTRAALYMGWDPDTLVARLQDLEIDPGEPDKPMGW
jgi:DNA-binding NtrC family response regulator